MYRAFQSFEINFIPDLLHYSRLGNDLLMIDHYQVPKVRCARGINPVQLYGNTYMEEHLHITRRTEGYASLQQLWILISLTGN